MDSPVTVIKTSLTPGNIFKFAVGTFIVLFLADLAGVTDWFMYPYQNIKDKFASKS